jgi:hypothetical protein
MRSAARPIRGAASAINETTQRMLLLRWKKLRMKPRRHIVDHSRLLINYGQWDVGARNYVPINAS